jgi:hypothetical protein
VYVFVVKKQSKIIMTKEQEIEFCKKLEAEGKDIFEIARLLEQERNKTP